MTFFILFLFVAYVAPVFFLKGAEKHAIEIAKQESHRGDSRNILASA